MRKLGTWGMAKTEKIQLTFKTNNPGEFFEKIHNMGESAKTSCGKLTKNAETFYYQQF